MRQRRGKYDLPKSDIRSLITMRVATICEAIWAICLSVSHPKTEAGQLYPARK
jgi:hypothetical protein